MRAMRISRCWLEHRSARIALRHKSDWKSLHAGNRSLAEQLTVVFGPHGPPASVLPTDQPPHARRRRKPRRRRPIREHCQGPVLVMTMNEREWRNVGFFLRTTKCYCLELSICVLECDLIDIV